MRPLIWILSVVILIAALLLAWLQSSTIVYEERNNAGIDFASTGDYPRAIEAFEAAVVIEPDNPIAYFNAADAYYLDEQTNQAYAALRQAVERGDTDIQVHAYYNLGNLYYLQTRCEEALAAYREALKLAPDNVDVRYNLELAANCLPTATPTAIEMQSEIQEQEVDPTQTPTPLPAGEDLPTPTPTPPQELPPAPSEEPTPSTNESGEASEEEQPTALPEEEKQLDVEDAQDLLDPVEANQENLSTFRTNYNQLTPQPSGEKDW